MMEERDKEYYEEEEENDEDEIESLEDLEGEKEVKEKLDPYYPEIYLNDSQVIPEKRVEFCSSTIMMKTSQRILLNYIHKYSGIRSRSEFIRHALLKYARGEMQIINAKREVDLEFTKKFKKIRDETLMRENNIKEKVIRLNKLKSQDEGESPFTTEDLME